MGEGAPPALAGAVECVAELMSSLGDMRRGYAELRRAEELNPALKLESVEMGLYQYVAGRLPALAKLVRALLFLPGGDAAASSLAQLEVLPATPLEVTARALLRLGQFDDAAGRRAASLARYSSLVTMPGLPGLRAEARRCLEHPCAITR